MNSSAKADFCIHVSLLGGRGSYYILNVLLTLFIFIVFSSFLTNKVRGGELEREKLAQKENIFCRSA